MAPIEARARSLKPLCLLILTGWTQLGSRTTSVTPRVSQVAGSRNAIERYRAEAISLLGGMPDRFGAGIARLKISPFQLVTGAQHVCWHMPGCALARDSSITTGSRARTAPGQCSVRLTNTYLYQLRRGLIDFPLFTATPASHRKLFKGFVP